MNYIVKQIKKRELKAGIWIAPFVASSKSKLFQKHPDWFLKDSQGKYFNAWTILPNSFPLISRFRALDPTLPAFQQHLTKIIQAFITWGFELIKIDFSYLACLSNRYYQPVTRAKALRIGINTIRRAAGPNIHLLSGLSPLSSLVGLVDSARVGVDNLDPTSSKIPVVNSLVNNIKLSSNLRNSNTRKFLNNVVWINDPDCLIFRKGTGIRKSLQLKHQSFVKNNNTPLWLGDNLSKLTNQELKELVDFMQDEN